MKYQELLSQDILELKQEMSQVAQQRLSIKSFSFAYNLLVNNMKIIIDPYRGGDDYGAKIGDKYEKDILLDLSNYMNNSFNNQNINSILTRNKDESLTDEDRVNQINKLKQDNDLIIQNRFDTSSDLSIIYPLRSSDKLASLIFSNLENNGISVNKYYQRRLPTNTKYDYYSIIKDTNPNETIIIEYGDADNYKQVVEIIVKSIIEYLALSDTYKVKSGDTLYSIAKKYNISVNELKELNNLKNNNITIGQVLKIKSNIPSEEVTEKNYYIVKSGDTLYSIAKKYNTTVDEIKKLNNLKSDNLSIGMELKIKEEPSSTNYIDYVVKSGDNLYSIAKKYNTTVDEIKKLNGLTSGLLNIGMTLKIPIQIGNYINYTVKSGDNLYSIAKKYNTTVDEIKKLNGLTSNLLSIGMELKIPL
jgi:LysM repeat protein